MSKKYFIVGVPRSGTTLLCNLFNSPPNSICLVEPHFSLKVNGFYDDGEYKIKNQSPKEFLADKEERYVGVKETYRNPWLDYKDENEDKIREWFEIYDSFQIGIIRDPRAVWISTINEWNPTRDHIQIYIDCWRNFFQFQRDENLYCIKYENLVLNTRDVLNEIKDNFNLDLELKPFIEKRSPEKLAGDDLAHTSTDIFQTSLWKWKDEIKEREERKIIRNCKAEMKNLDYINKNEKQ